MENFHDIERLRADEILREQARLDQQERVVDGKETAPPGRRAGRLRALIRAVLRR